MRNFCFIIIVISGFVALSFNGSAQTSGQPVLGHSSRPTATIPRRQPPPAELKQSAKENAAIKKSTDDSLRALHPPELKRIEKYPGIKTQYSK